MGGINGSLSGTFSEGWSYCQSCCGGCSREINYGIGKLVCGCGPGIRCVGYVKDLK